MNVLEKAKNKESQKGFTIIEVVLVLAIAGLIFLMVFIALPALQRNQRDTQRKNDMARVQTAIVNYTNANRGTIPAAGNAAAWTSFKNSYLTAGGDTFLDPSGAPSGSSATSYAFTQSTDTTLTQTFATSQNTIYYTTGAICGTASSDTVAAGSRKVAFRLALEGGGYSCVNN